MYQPLLSAADSFESLRIADASLDRIARVMDAAEQPVPATATATLDTFDVEFDGVSFGYTAIEPVLHDVRSRPAPAR